MLYGDGLKYKFKVHTWGIYIDVMLQLLKA